MEQLDLRLYAVVDPEHTGGHDLVDLACAVATGGATLVQLRDKGHDTDHMIEQAHCPKGMPTPLRGSLIINHPGGVGLAGGGRGAHRGPAGIGVTDVPRRVWPGA